MGNSTVFSVSCVAAELLEDIKLEARTSVGGGNFVHVGHCCGLYLKCPQSSCVKNSVPTAGVFRGEAFERRFDQEDRILNWEVVETLHGGT